MEPAIVTRTSNHPPARLLSRTAKYRNHVVFGFLLDSKVAKTRSAEAWPLPPDIKDPFERNLIAVSNMGLWYNQLVIKCNDVWDPPWTEIGTIYSRPHKKTILVLVKCTRPDDKFLPPPGDLEKMKEIMAQAGFQEEPSWYTPG